VVTILVDGGANVNVTDEDGETIPLHAVCATINAPTTHENDISPDPEIIRVLSLNGADFAGARQRRPSARGVTTE
jgi:hypothetical protein